MTEIRKPAYRLPRTLLILIAGVSCLAGCGYTPSRSAGDIDIASGFSASGDAALSVAWWSNFNDQSLNRWVELGLQRNQTLLAARGRLQQSQALNRKAASDFFPDLSFNASNRDRYLDTGDSNTRVVGLSSSWELDLWGRIDALDEKSSWDAVAAEAAVRARANLVAGNIADAWFGWVAESSKRQLLQGQYLRVELALTAIKRRFALGRVSVTDMWQQQRLLESIRGQQARTQAQTALFREQLALWLGISTEELALEPAAKLPLLPPLPVTGVPLVALRERPDIQQAFARLHAADANVAAAVSERFPRIVLSGRYESDGSQVTRLFDDWLLQVTTGLVLPLFDAGQRRAVVEQRRADWTIAQADYQQVWYEAIGEVEEALIREEQFLSVADSLEKQLALAHKTESIQQIAYLNGRTDYLRLLRAQETTLELERQLVDAQRDLIQTRVKLYRSLSHGQFFNTADKSGDPVVGSRQHSDREYSVAAMKGGLVRL